MMTSIFRNACPRNCYSTCTILSTVKNDRIIKVEGDKQNEYTRGALCAKGYAYTQYVDNPYRIKYPLKQVPRNSGNWVRITWQEAYHTIATKILSLYKRNQSNLGIGYNKFSGNLGLLHFAVEGMFNSFGPHTKCIGNPCNLSGEKAMKDIFGENIFIAPEKMNESDCVVIWGANPCVTNIHQMKFIFEAQDKGAKFIVIDPVYTQTAKHADLYIQIEPGKDYLLALGIIKWLVENKKINILSEKMEGTKELFQLASSYSYEQISQESKVSFEAIELLATTYVESKQIATWIGFGLQRYRNGEETVANICNVSNLLNGYYERSHAIYYSNYTMDKFKNNLYNFPEKSHPTLTQSREVHLNNFAREALDLKDPKLKLLWIASRNPLSQDSNLSLWKELVEQLDLVVVVDLFMTKTTNYADIVLPTTTQFEDIDLNYSYWNNWLTYNEKAIPNYYDAKSDLQIARELTAYLNQLSPGFSTFPNQLEPDDWIEKELTEEIKKGYNIHSIEDLKLGPKKYVNQSKVQNYKLKVSESMAPHMESSNTGQYQLITPQSLLKIHSQYAVTNWLDGYEEEDIVEISSSAIKKENLMEGEKVRIFNEVGFVYAKVRLNNYLPPSVILFSQAGREPINNVIFQDNELKKASSYFYDVKVNLEKVGRNDDNETAWLYI